MNRAELIGTIGQLGCILLRHGAAHDWYRSPATGVCQPVPHDGEIKDVLARHIIAMLCKPEGRDSGRRLAELEQRFAAAVESAKLEAMAEFAAGAGHEINNPLTVIAGRAQLFLRQETDPERRRALALINAQAMRVYEMIADMRLFARPPRPMPERVDAVALVDRVVAEFGPRAAQQETEIRRTGDSGPIELNVDPAQMMVALGAMCQNALEALGGPGKIEIGVHRREDEVEIDVADDGPGITPEEREHLFDPFYSARQAGRGLGLGLSKAWRIVTNHGGRIEVLSRPRHGATFRILLPC